MTFPLILDHLQKAQSSHSLAECSYRIAVLAPGLQSVSSRQFQELEAEIVGTPIEVFESGKDASIKVYYDRELKAQRMVIQVGTEENVIAASEIETKL